MERMSGFGRARAWLTVAVMAGAVLVPGVGTAADAGVPEAIAPVLKAAGLGSVRSTYLKVDISEEETTPGGETKTRHETLWVRFPQLEPVRLELAPDIILVRKKDETWASVHGKLDKRPQSARMIRGTQNEKLFPYFMPFSLRLGGVHIEAAGTKKFEGATFDAFTVNFEKNFFGVPVMETHWTILVEPDTHRVATAAFIPEAAFRSVVGEGVRYRYLRWTEVAGATLPSTVVIEGFAPETGVASGHVSVVKLAYTVEPNPPVELFANPETLEKLDED